MVTAEKLRSMSMAFLPLSCFELTVSQVMELHSPATDVLHAGCAALCNLVTRGTYIIMCTDITQIGGLPKCITIYTVGLFRIA